MRVQVVENGQNAVIVGTPAVRLMQTPDDVITLIETCFEHHVRAVVLHAENLTARFFDLSSGEAGEILQKLRNYRIRLAVVAAPDAVALSRPFQALMIEERQGRDFGIFADRPAAEAWLLAD
jgi:hypothetical protein